MATFLFAIHRNTWGDMRNEIGVFFLLLSGKHARE